MFRPILLTAIGLAAWALARARPKVEIPALILTMFAALTAHSVMQWAFLAGRFDTVVGDPRESGLEVLAPIIAAVEGVGLWLPVLLIPWAPPRARIWAALYMLLAAGLAALYFYFPFDLVVIRPEFISTGGPPYLFAVFLCLPIGLIGFAIGWLRSQSELV